MFWSHVFFFTCFYSWMRVLHCLRVCSRVVLSSSENTKRLLAQFSSKVTPLMFAASGAFLLDKFLQKNGAKKKQKQVLVFFPVSVSRVWPD